MKISASIYSDRSRPLKEVVMDLVDHKVDLLHVDCNDDLKVFEDIRQIREWTQTPIDLHIITEAPDKYHPLLIENPVEYVTFQYEQLPKGYVLPQEIPGKRGLSVITPTPVYVFSEYADFDFILIMATIPGQSGGSFDALNFSKIRTFRNSFPGKAIHVDGGVNGEVSFILRNMGVASSVSGSYLFKGPSIGNALMDLTKRELTSQFHIQDFMIPFEECPILRYDEMSVGKALQVIEDGKLGFCLVCGEKNELKGLISNADIRRGFLKNVADFNQLKVEELINPNPTKLLGKQTVSDMLQVVRESKFPISYLPVVDEANKAIGILTFVNLIKGEL